LGWYIFKGPDGDFSLAFPAKPQPLESDVEGPVTTIRHYHLSTKDGKYFSVNIQDMGGDPLSRDANEFDQNDESIVAVAARERGEARRASPSTCQKYIRNGSLAVCQRYAE